MYFYITRKPLAVTIIPNKATKPATILNQRQREITNAKATRTDHRTQTQQRKSTNHENNHARPHRTQT